MNNLDKLISKNKLSLSYKNFSYYVYLINEAESIKYIRSLIRKKKKRFNFIYTPIFSAIHYVNVYRRLRKEKNK